MTKERFLLRLPDVPGVTLERLSALEGRPVELPRRGGGVFPAVVVGLSFEDDSAVVEIEAEAADLEEIGITLDGCVGTIKRVW